MPALMRFVGASSRGGFSMNAITRPASSVGTTPNIDGSSTGVRWRVPSAPRARWKSTSDAHIEIGEDVAVHDEKRLVDAGLTGREADGAGGVERLRLDGVAQTHTGAGGVRERFDERVGLVPERQDRLVDAERREVADHPVDHRPMDDRQHLLRLAERQRSQSGAEAPDEDDRPHEPVVAAAVDEGAAGS